MTHFEHVPEIDHVTCTHCDFPMLIEDVAPCGEALCDRHDPCDCPHCHAIYNEVTC